MRNVRLLPIILLVVLWPRGVPAQVAQSASGFPSQLEPLRLQTSESRSAQGFRYRVLSSDDLVVKQYINPATNAVFGVTWKGTRRPSLLVLLGIDPSTIKGPGVFRSLHVGHIRTQNLNIESTALMGRYTGMAVRTDLLPHGVSATVVTP